jgi:hypothetical protein
MQTSFMHPPFGFALFYLRGISDTLYKNGALPRKVESRDIYLGAIPFIVIQLVLVAIVIFFPQTVTAFLDKEKVVDLDKASEAIQQMGVPQRLPPTLTLPPPAAPGSGESPAAPGGASAGDDATNAVLDALKKESEAKKP